MLKENKLKAVKLRLQVDFRRKGFRSDDIFSVA